MPFVGIPRAALVPVIARASVLSTLIPPMVAMAALRRLVRLALDFLRGTMEAAQLLTQRFDLALVSGLLALSQFEQFQHFVELIQ